MRFLADENFDNRVLHGLIRRIPELEIVRVQDTVLAEADDPVILAWTAEHGYILLTHDYATMADFAYDRVRSGLPFPGDCIWCATAVPTHQIHPSSFILQNGRSLQSSFQEVVEKQDTDIFFNG